MGQIHPGFIADMLKHCERGEHPPLTVWEAQQLLTLAQRALAASPAPAPQEPAARFLLVAMDDDGCGNPVFCADEKAVRAALAPLLFFFNDEHPLSAEHDAEVDAQLEALLEDGFLRFEGDPGINLYKLHAHLYASPAPGELGAVDAAAWLPIETAPKDGAWVLVYWPTIPISLYPFCAFYDEGWQHPSFRDYGEVFPTHWMPLPQPPQQAPSESSGRDQPNKCKLTECKGKPRCGTCLVMDRSSAQGSAQAAGSTQPAQRGTT